MARRHLRQGAGLGPDGGVRAAALAALLLGLADGDAPDLHRGRWHFEMEGTPRFAYSILFTRGPAGDETRLLVESASGRVELVSRQDGSGRDSIEIVKDAATGESFTRRLALSGYEAVPGCAAVKPPDACVVLEGKEGRLETSLGAFGGDGAGALRTRAAMLVSGPMRAWILGLGPLFPQSAEFGPYTDDFLGLIWPETFRDQRRPPLKARRTPGCAFDAGFGYPCSEAERRREAARYPPKGPTPSM